ncbi:hypothetical protein KSS87_013485 [Heliosperma pusillum]|nr:hypothetical protein KSS87_013485 [Heliosperma pusillum]
MKGDKMNKGSSLGSRVRKRLSDITNLHSNSKSPFKDQLNSNNHLPIIHDSSSINNHVHHLLKELNLSKDRLKALQHDLACKDALYKAKMNDAQVKEKMQGEENIKLEGKAKPEKADVDKPKQANENNENTVSKTKRGRVTRSHSLGATNSQQDADKEIAENKRRCLRRQSVRLKPKESDADLYEVDVNASQSQSLEGRSRLSISDSEEPSRSSIADRVEPSSQSPKPTLPPQRTSIGRPSRKAAEKIQSYKAMPLNLKMRRPC